MASEPVASSTTVELARAMVDAQRPLAGDTDAPTLRAVAWALKDLCYAAWSTEPERAGRVAQVLRNMRELSEAEPQAEIGALADWTAGIAHLTRGEMTEAVRCLDSAATAFRDIGQSRHASETQVPKIMALSMLGRYDEAVTTAEHAHADFIRDGDQRAAAKVSLNLGSLHLRRDHYRRAASNYRDAAVLFARVRDPQHSIMADIGMADALTAQGAFEEALRIYARAGMRAATHGFPVLSAMQAESLALLELARGHYAEALAGFERSRRAYEGLGMPQHLAIAEKQLADAYLELRLVPEALALFSEALARFEAQEMIDDVAWTTVQQGRAHALAGHADGAISALASAAAMFEEQQNTAGAATVALARAELDLANGDATAALRFAHEAAEGFRSAALAERELRAQAVEADALLEAGSLIEAERTFAAVLERARAIQVIGVQVRCLTGQGIVALARHDVGSARAAFHAAIRMFDEQRRALPGDELRDAFLADHLRPYRELLRIELGEHAGTGTHQTATRVLHQLELFRARALGERLAAPQDGEENPATLETRARVNWLRRRVTSVGDEGGDISVPLADLRSAESELLERARRQRLVGVSGSGAPLDDEASDLEALQGRLREGDVLVEYGRHDDELFACTVTRDEVLVHRALGSWSDVQAMVRSARFQIEALRHGTTPIARHLPMLAQRTQLRMHRLHDVLWAPLGAAVGTAQRVLIVPHGALGALPFCALHDGSRYLAERVDVAVVGSARLGARGLVRDTRPPKQALLMGVSRSLPHAAREVAFVASLLPGVRAFIDEAATVQAFTAHSGDADLIHLACHAQFRSDNPMFSALQLNDGAITAESVERLSLRSATVVLSACETALAGESAGDEMFGLVRGFVVAGAARVVASLWPIEDAATEAMMATFYTALRAGAAPSVALRRAQCDLMRSHSHPFHWAAFAVYGGW
ncbi:MAG: CHAT domain-containing tetratricopeptide repeat protein [Pseudomonadota bacterium]|nr:CHAT domain-containing tetratricopeptide repeat protein [Pseudomonadota bacterium]